MAQQNLTTVITIGGKVDNTFGTIGDSLTALGTQIDQVSQKIINFGRDSVETYVQYDDAMRETQAVGGYTTREMERLDELNRQIAQTSTYTNLQSANAMVLIAQAGLDLADVEAILPETLDLAMAGNLDLADSVDYLISSLQALGYEMDYADELVDQMAKTASIGMTDIDTLGESLMRLGSGAQMFKGGSVEILSILSAMSQFGHDQRGSQGGTWLRNFMLSLAAPAGNIDDIVDAMEQLGIAQEEIDEYAESHSTGVAATAVQSLVDEGLRIYDSKGQLLPAIDIIKSLRDTVRGSDKYADDLTELTSALNDAGGDIDAFVQNTENLSDNALYGVFSKIFGKRGITTALNLISISDEEWNQIFSDVQNSDGFAESMADTMQGGLGGALRELEAAWTELKTTFGETIAPEVEGVADFLHDTAVSISTMDKDKLDALVSGIGVIAAAGPAMMLAGGAFKLIGFAMTPIGGATLGLVALTAACTAVAKLAEADFESNFGNLELDTEALIGHVTDIGDAFNDAYTDVNNYNSALGTAVANFESASSTLSGDLLTSMITGATLTEEQIKSIESLGETMHQALLDGIDNSMAGSISYLQLLFGGEENAVLDPEYQDAVLLADSVYNQLKEQAEEIGKDFGETIGSAMDDGIITGDEYNAIMEKMQAYNDAMAFAAEADKAAELAQQLHKAQSVSWDSASGFLAEQAAIMDANLAEAEMTHVGERAKWGVYYDEAIQQGWINPLTGAAYTEADKNKFLDDMDLQYQDKIQGYKDDNAKVVMGVYDALMSQSGYGEAWQFLSRLYTSGDLKRDKYGEVAWDAMDWASLFPEGMPLYGEDNPIADQLYDLWRGEHGLSGIDNKLTKILEPYMDSEFIALIPKMLDDALTIDNYLYGHSAESGREDLEFGTTIDSGIYDLLDAMERGIAAGDYSAIGAAWDALPDFGAEKYSRIMSSLQNVYDFERVLADMGGAMSDANNPYRNQIAAYQLMYGDIDAEEYLITAQVDPVVPEGAIEEAAGDPTIGATVLPEGADAALAEAQGEMADGLTADAAVVGLYDSAVEERDSAQAYLTANPGEWTVKTKRTGGLLGGLWGGLDLFAEGGRATEASIFGEAGAEWAIPEEHTANTASLIWQAAQASGFTWDDIGAANGQSGSGGGNTLVYAPTIIAADATGVEQKLRESKEDLERWLKERELKDKIAVYS